MFVNGGHCIALDFGMFCYTVKLLTAVIWLLPLKFLKFLFFDLSYISYRNLFSVIYCFHEQPIDIVWSVWNMLWTVFLKFQLIKLNWEVEMRLKWVFSTNVNDIQRNVCFIKFVENVGWMILLFMKLVEFEECDSFH